MQYDGRLPAEGVEADDGHPLREFALLLGGLVAAAIAFVAVAAVAIDLVVPLVPAGLEARWLGGWFDPAREADRDPRDAVIQALLDRLAGHWADHPYEFRVGLIEDDEPNALALPGGAILVTTGLLACVESENELALVLGHELGHFHGRDHLRGLGRGLASALVLAVVGSGGEVAAGVAGLAGQLTERAFDRDQESRADAFGLALVQAEYGHVAGAGDFFARLARAGDEGGLSGYLSTHPLHADRVAQLRADAEAHAWPTAGPLTPLALPAVDPPADEPEPEE